MFVIKIQGGLGNQLLQYGFGRALTLLYGKEVAYDLCFFNNNNKYTRRSYLLDHFKVHVKTASQKEIARAKYPYGFLSIFLRLFTKISNKYFFKKYYVGYTPGFMESLRNKNNVYLEGFWQSYHYYKQILDILEKEVSLKNPKTVEKIKKETNFEKKISVSVHIRRGDFLDASSGIKSLDKAYYEKAVSLLEEKINMPSYYVFSDDIEWVKKEMGYLFKNAFYVSGLGLTDCEEFILMKECNHAIIANSTFSWFSALLSNAPEKLVIYSKDWKNSFLNKDSEICPVSWHGI